MAKLELRFRFSTSDEDTLARIERVAKRSGSITEPHVRAILYLRAASARADLCHANFYLYVGATISSEAEIRSWIPSHRVRQYAIRYSAINTIALGIRSIYDDAKNSDLNAKRVVSLSDFDLEKVVSYYGGKGDTQPGLRLALIQRVLARGAVSINAAASSSCVLARRIALMKAYADRQAAHVSLDNYEYDVFDVAHVVAATAIVGAIIHELDDPSENGVEWLDAMDRAAYEAAAELFPALKPQPRMFDRCDLPNLFKTVIEGKITEGSEYLSTWLLSALGWDNPPREIAEIWKSVAASRPSAPAEPAADGGPEASDRPTRDGIPRAPN